MTETDLEKEFEKIWRHYPNKQGKAKAKQSYIKARKNGTSYEEVIKGLDNYICYCSKEQSWYRPKNGSTWFNQNCWLDEIEGEEETQALVKDKYGNIIL